MIMIWRGLSVSLPGETALEDGELMQVRERCQPEVKLDVARESSCMPGTC